MEEKKGTEPLSMTGLEDMYKGIMENTPTGTGYVSIDLLYKQGVTKKDLISLRQKHPERLWVDKNSKGTIILKVSDPNKTS